MNQSLHLSFKPVTPNNWEDLVTLFSSRGAPGDCWCMWFRLSQAQFARQRGEGNKQALQAIINSGEVPGILAYDGDKPVGWCSVAPRSHFSSLERSRILKQVDDKPVWSIVCFFIAKPYRRKGIMNFLLSSAITYATQNGAKIIEGYPLDPQNQKTPDANAYHGLKSSFLQLGFQEVARRSESRPIMRYSIKES